MFLCFHNNITSQVHVLQACCCHDLSGFRWKMLQSQQEDKSSRCWIKGLTTVLGDGEKSL